MRRSRLHALALTATSAVLFVSAAAGQAQAVNSKVVSPTDYCAAQCSDILPPGENGAETLADILLFKLFGVRPSHNNDQLASYDNLATSYTGLAVCRTAVGDRASPAGRAATSHRSMVLLSARLATIALSGLKTTSLSALPLP